jgi:hypothetical protein
LDSHELAWAAGFFDGEGWANRSGRGVQSRINQAGLNGVPEVLLKFQRIVGVGRLKGPLLKDGKEPLYYWEATSRPDVSRVAELIGPWLGPIKRGEVEAALASELAPVVWPGSSSEELAWAGGLFDGEGSTYLTVHRTHAGYRNAAVELPQSGWDGIPVVLTRFHAALGGVGHLNGPHVYDWADAPVSRWKCEAQDHVQLVIHRLLPFVGSVKRAQALRVLSIVNQQPRLPRGNPSFGVAGARYCLRGHDKWNARIRPFRGRGVSEVDPERHLRQCLTCVREAARARYLAGKRNVRRRDR